MVRSPGPRERLRQKRKPSQKLTENGDREEKAVGEGKEKKVREMESKLSASSTTNKGKKVEETSL